MDKFAVAWVVWAMAFIVIEFAALLDKKPGGTLSEGIWAFLGGGPARYVLIGAVLFWLVVHFLGKGRWG